MSGDFDAIVLAGGEGTRLGRVDKALLTAGGATFLERVLGAVQAATRVVCVGPERETPTPVTWTQEDPPGAGPVAAVAAGLQFIDSPTVVVVAVDAAFMTATVVRDLVARCTEDAALLVDGSGRRQPLMAAYRSDFLRGAIMALAETDGASMHQLITGARMTLFAQPDAARDVDTPRQLEAARQEIDR